MKLILDASVAGKWVLRETDSDKANDLRAAFCSGVHAFFAPDFFPGEVGHALTKAERQGRISIGQALVLWTDVMTTPPNLVAALPLTARAIAISSQTRLGVFDCLYVALAERENCELVSADQRMLNSLRGHFSLVRDLATFP